MFYMLGWMVKDHRALAAYVQEQVAWITAISDNTAPENPPATQLYTRREADRPFETWTSPISPEESHKESMDLWYDFDTDDNAESLWESPVEDGTPEVARKSVYEDLLEQLAVQGHTEKTVPTLFAVVAELPAQSHPCTSRKPSPFKPPAVNTDLAHVKPMSQPEAQIPRFSADYIAAKQGRYPGTATEAGVDTAQLLYECCNKGSLSLNPRLRADFGFRALATFSEECSLLYLFKEMIGMGLGPRILSRWGNENMLRRQIIEFYRGRSLSDLLVWMPFEPQALADKGKIDPSDIIPPTVLASDLVDFRDTYDYLETYSCYNRQAAQAAQATQAAPLAQTPRGNFRRYDIEELKNLQNKTTMTEAIAAAFRNFAASLQTTMSPSSTVGQSTPQHLCKERDKHNEAKSGVCQSNQAVENNSRYVNIGAMDKWCASSTSTAHRTIARGNATSIGCTASSATSPAVSPEKVNGIMKALLRSARKANNIDSFKEDLDGRRSQNIVQGQDAVQGQGGLQAQGTRIDCLHGCPFALRNEKIEERLAKGLPIRPGGPNDLYGVSGDEG